MTPKDMLKYMVDPTQLNEYSLSELRAVLSKYPYFHAAHVLFLLNLKNIHDPRYREFLKQSAVHIKDRDKYLRWVHQLQGAVSESQPEAPAGPSQTGKAAETKKDKDFSTEYLRSRISETLSEQKGDAQDDERKTPELGSDFFIMDKVSQVEEKMAKRLREEYQKQNAKEQSSGKKDRQDDADSFELDGSDGGEAASTKQVFNFGGEYFSEKDYRKNQEAARKKQSDLIEQFIRKAPELGGITPSEKDHQDISQESVQEKEDIASEKLVKVYIQQGYYHKAIEAYEKLSLKYPEKSDYFAEQIEKLKSNIRKQKK